MKLKDALNFIKEKRNVCPNAGFMKQLERYEEEILMNKKLNDSMKENS